MDNLTIVIPAYNEEKALALFLPELISFCRTNGCSLIIVNDGSKDNTAALLAEFAQEPFFTPLHHKVNRGYGGALKSGLCVAETEYVITIDADGQHRLADVEALYQVMLDNDADLVIGKRQIDKESRYRKFGKSLIRSVASLLMPIHIQDLNSGMKIYRTEQAKRYICLCPNTMAFSDVITLVFINQQRLVLEHSINTLPRVTGTSTITTKTAFETVMEILHIVTMFNPMRIFLPPAFFFLLFSAVWGLPIMFRGEGISVGTLFLFVTGLLFFFLGLLAEQMALIRKSITLSMQTEINNDPEKVA
ncbi:MAG: glycosyltransferase family 2 protein [Candidatus Electrothrix sp. MAN1_4]|nr:glycosyltransferase family 2 protein [Candidatus Electrothrix sp. MAN1_4]